MHRVATPDHIMEAVVGNDRAGYVHNFIYKIIQWKNVPVKLARRNVYVFIRRAPSSFYTTASTQFISMSSRCRDSVHLSQLKNKKKTW